jgi:hypothetical protein
MRKGQLSTVPNGEIHAEASAHALIRRRAGTGTGTVPCRQRETHSLYGRTDGWTGNLVMPSWMDGRITLQRRRVSACPSLASACLPACLVLSSVQFLRHGHRSSEQAVWHHWYIPKSLQPRLLHRVHMYSGEANEQTNGRTEKKSLKTDERHEK